jgi:aspartate/methionine/tyrosine aminotransferase
MALTHGEGEVELFRSQLASVKTRLAGALRQLPGVEAPEPDGAMYLFFGIQGRRDSLKLARELIERAGLGLAPGRAFGPEGEGWLRWCYAAEWSKVEEGIKRLTRFLGH